MEHDLLFDPSVIRPYGPQDPTTGLHRGYEWTAEARVGERTRKHREGRGWSQEELGRRLEAHGFGMHQTTVAKLEGGGRPIRLNEVHALAIIFGVPLAAFLEEEVEKRVEVGEAAFEVWRLQAKVAEASVSLASAGAELARQTAAHAEAVRSLEDAQERLEELRRG